MDLPTATTLVSSRLQVVGSGCTSEGRAPEAQGARPFSAAEAPSFLPPFDSGVSNYGPKELRKVHKKLAGRGVPLASAQVGMGGMKTTDAAILGQGMGLYLPCVIILAAYAVPCHLADPVLAAVLGA